MTDKLKIIFAGTPDFAAVALTALLDAKQNIVAVYTQPDRPAGRGRKLTASAVKQLALAHDLPLEQPETLKDETTVEKLKTFNADVMIVAAYGLLLPKDVLEIPVHGCINIHASLLPRWRGAAPIQRAILAGDRETGITIMQMDSGLDTGDMLLKLTTPISGDDNAGSLHDRLAILGGKAIVEAINLLEQNKLSPEKQDNAYANYAKKLDKREAWIDWSQSADQIHQQINAFNPWPIAQTLFANKIIRIRETQAEPENTDKPPGTVLKQDKTGIVVACGKGRLRLLNCQIPNSKPMPVGDLLNGHPELFTVGSLFTTANSRSE